MMGDLVRDREPAEADRRYRLALDIARRQRALTLELKASTSLARLRVAEGQGEQARALLAPVYARFSEGFDVVDLREARALLEAL